MHDGITAASLEGVAFFYAGGGRNNEWLSFRSLPKPPGGNPFPGEAEDLANMLRALTGDTPENAGPPDE